MKTEYEVKNHGATGPFIAGLKIWRGFKMTFPNFEKATLFVGVRNVTVTRLRPSRTRIRKMRVAGLRELCAQEGLSSEDDRETLVNRLLGTEVRK